MEVRSGWSAGYAKKKFDVTLGEHDLLLWLQERGLGPGVVDEMTVREKFLILHYEAEIYAIGTEFQYHNESKQFSKEVAFRIQQLVTNQQTILAGIRKRLSLEEPVEQC